MAKTSIGGANAVFTGPQLGLTVLGSRCYAYSGLVLAPAGGATNLLDFATGTEPIAAHVQFGADWEGAGSQYIQWQIYFNGLVIYYNRPRGNYGTGDDLDLRLIIPPFTTVVVEVLSQGEQETTVLLTGRVVYE